MNLRPYQTDLINSIRRAWQSRRRVMAQLPTGGGKCLGKDTLVLMADGRILPVQEIRQGDKIMGDDSQPRTVISVNVGREMLYRITPVKGDSWVCNESHVLSLTSAGTDCGFEKNGIYDMELREYLSLNKTQKHLLKQYRSKVQEFHNNENQLPIEPYFLGVLLGDGSLKRSICVTTPDPEIVAEVDKQARIFGLAVRHEIMEGNKASNYYLINHDGRRNGRNGGTNPIANILKSLGLRNSCYDKFIPFIYKTASWNDRLEVLAGLIDTDGHYGHQFEFSSSSRLLAEDVAFISRSLGLAAYISNKVINLQTYYRVVISGDIDIIPTRISRKRATPRLQIKSVLRTGFTVEPIGIGDYYGFEIDGNRRFLLGDFTVTHNTVIFNSIIQEAQQQGRRCMMIVHRKELITQAGRKLYKMGVDYGVIMAGYDSRYSAPVQLASVQTLIRRSMPKGIDILITDECHHATAQSYRDIYAEYPNAKFLGVTATPIRTNGEGFADLFDTLVCGATVTELIADGYLVAPQIYASPTALDLAKIKKTGGDYNERALAEAMDNKRLVGGLVEQWTKHCYGRQTVTFAITVEHSKHIVEQYRAAGISAEHIDGTTPQDRRDKIIADFAKGQFKVLSNVGIVTEGFDVPEIEVVQLARPTTSLALYLQMVGRGLRPAAGKGKAIVLDHADCVFEHGFPEQDRKWTLKGIPKREKAETERKVMARDKTGQMFMSNELPAHITDIELVEIDYSQARIKALEKCVAEAKQYSPKPAAGWYRFEKNVLKGTRATEYEIQHFYRISPKWDKKNHFISYKMVEYGHRPTERYPWMDKSKSAIRFPQTAV